MLNEKINKSSLSLLSSTVEPTTKRTSVPISETVSSPSYEFSTKELKKSEKKKHLKALSYSSKEGSTQSPESSCVQKKVERAMLFGEDCENLPDTMMTINDIPTFVLFAYHHLLSTSKEDDYTGDGKEEYFSLFSSIR